MLERFPISAKRLVPIALFVALVIITAALVHGRNGGGGEGNGTAASSAASTKPGSHDASATRLSNSGDTVSDPIMATIQRGNFSSRGALAADPSTFSGLASRQKARSEKPAS